MTDPFEFEFEKNPLRGPSDGASFSTDRRYRYVLWRMWDIHKPYVNFVLLNPSTADEVNNDATIRALQRQAKAKSYGGIVVTNAYAYRATTPDDVKRARAAGVDVIGMPRNEQALVVWAKNAGCVVAGWGANCDKIIDGRGRAIMTLMRALDVRVYAFALNKDGSPMPPLYISPSSGLTEVPR